MHIDWLMSEVPRLKTLIKNPSIGNWKKKNLFFPMLSWVKMYPFPIDWFGYTWNAIAAYLPCHGPQSFVLSTKKYENTGSSGLPCHQVHLDLRGQELPHCRFLTLLPNNGGWKLKGGFRERMSKKIKITMSWKLQQSRNCSDWRPNHLLECCH